MSNRYLSYGLCIESELVLPELMEASDETVDVTIRFGPVKRPAAVSRFTGGCYATTACEAYLFWDQVGAFSVREGREIILAPKPGTAGQLLRLPLLGMVTAMLLYQRGYLVLHASAVSIEEEVVAFLGQKGWGKSTIAAALHARGHGVVADDVVALIETEQQPVQVAPGFPQLKLWPEAAAASLGDDPAQLSPLYTTLEKRARPVREGFTTAALPLRGIYVLGNGVASVDDISPQQALIELVRHSFALEFMQDREMSAAHFCACGRLVRSVPIRRLSRPRDLAGLPRLAGLIEADCLRALPEPI